MWALKHPILSLYYCDQNLNDNVHKLVSGVNYFLQKKIEFTDVCRTIFQLLIELSHIEQNLLSNIIKFWL
jgi:hypothetical protein